MPTKKKHRKRLLKRLNRAGYRYKNRLYFCSSGPQIFLYSTEYMERLKGAGDPKLIDALLNGDWDTKA